MLAVLPRLGAGASAHAELRGADEAGPFGVLEVGSESVAEDLRMGYVSATLGWGEVTKETYQDHQWGYRCCLQEIYSVRMLLCYEEEKIMAYQNHGDPVLNDFLVRFFGY